MTSSTRSIRKHLSIVLAGLALGLGSAGIAHAQSSGSCDASFADASDLAELALELGSTNQKLRSTLAVAKKAFRFGTTFDAPSEGVTEDYFWCLKERIDQGREWIGRWNLNEQEPPEGPTLEDMAGRSCSEFEKATRPSSQGFERIVQKNRKAIEKLDRYDEKLGAFEHLTHELASVARDLFAQGLWSLGYDWINLDELSRDAALVRRGVVADARRALAKNLESYDAKLANLKAWQAEFERCSESKEAKRKKPAVDPRMLEFILEDSKQSGAPGPRANPLRYVPESAACKVIGSC